MSDTLAHRLKALPVAFEGTTVVLAVADGTEETAARIREAITHPVRLRLAAQSDLMRAIDTAYRALVGVESQVKVFEARDSVRRDVVRTDNDVASDDAPVVQVVQQDLTQALRDRASDIHIEPQDERVRVRFRIDGALHDVLDAARLDGAGAGQPDQDHGRHEHRRAAPAAGRPDRHRRSTAAPSTSASPPSPRSGREGRAAAARQEPAAVRARAARHAAPTMRRAVLELIALAVRHGHLRRPDRQRQDHDALRDR